MKPRKRQRIIIRSPKRGAVVLMATVLATLVATAVAQVWTHLRAIEYGYKISKASRIRTRLLEQQRRLSIELALLKDPARIAKIATTRLGLQVPEPDQMRILRRRSDRSPRSTWAQVAKPTPLANTPQ